MAESTMNQLNNQKNPTQLFYCSPVLISRPWRIPLNNQLSIINTYSPVRAGNQWKGQSTISHRLTGELLRQTRYEKMQNEPNLKANAHIPASPHGSRATSHESRFMQNKPNFTRKSTIENCKSLYSFTHPPIHSFTHPPIHPKMQNKPNWRIYDQIFSSTHIPIRSFTPSCKTNPISNLPPPFRSPHPPGHERSLPAVRVAGIKMQNEPNSKYNEHKHSIIKGLHKYLHPALSDSTNNQ
jgi:hypothetical protein